MLEKFEKQKKEYEEEIKKLKEELSKDDSEIIKEKIDKEIFYLEDEIEELKEKLEAREMKITERLIKERKEKVDTYIKEKEKLEKEYLQKMEEIKKEIGKIINLHEYEDAMEKYCDLMRKWKNADWQKKKLRPLERVFSKAIEKFKEFYGDIPIALKYYLKINKNRYDRDGWMVREIEDRLELLYLFEDEEDK